MRENKRFFDHNCSQAMAYLDDRPRLRARSSRRPLGAEMIEDFERLIHELGHRLTECDSRSYPNVIIRDFGMNQVGAFHEAGLGFGLNAVDGSITHSGADEEEEPLSSPKLQSASPSTSSLASGMGPPAVGLAALYITLECVSRAFMSFSRFPQMSESSMGWLCMMAKGYSWLPRRT